MKVKSRILIIIIALFLYFVITYLYNKVSLKNSFFEAYVLKNDVKKGEEVNIYNLEKIKYKSQNVVKDLEIDTDLSNFVYSYDFESGKILTTDMICVKEEYDEKNEDKEIIAIKVDKLEDNLCSTIVKNSYINVYASAKSLEIESLLNIDNLQSYSSNSTTGITTIKLLKNVRVVNVYDINGSVTNENSKIDSILIEVDKDLAIKINNLKTYASFTLSLSGDI